MATIIYHQADRRLAEQTQGVVGDLGADVTIIIISAQAVADASIKDALADALERNHRIIPILASKTALPRLIEHLDPLDFSTGFQPDTLMLRLNEADRGNLHLKVLTPETIARNRRAGIVVSVIALLVFLISLYAVGVLGIQAPTEEYDSVETQVVETLDAIMEDALPHSTEEALNFPMTLEAAAPTARPFIAATATARAAGNE